MALFKRTPLTSSRLAERKRKIFVAKIIFYILFVALCVYGATWFSRQPQFQIANVEISGNINVDASEIQSVVESNLASAYFFLFPRSNKFIYPGKKIENEVLQDFPGISRVELTVKNQTLAIAVVERVPAYLWCAGTPENQGTCYFMDNAGYIFSEAPNFSGHTYFAYYGMISADNPVRLTYLDSKQFEDLNLIQNGLVKIGLPTFAENSSADGARELYLNSGGKIIFKNTADPAMLISSLSMVKSQTSILNQGAQPLDYIDMRFGNKVYYKFVGDNAIQASP